MIKPMDVTPEVSMALATLRSQINSGHASVASLKVAFDVLDNVGVFAEIDEANDYASAEEIMAEINAASVPNTADPAEWGDTTSADMARHQGLVDDPADIEAAVRRANCKCGRPDEPSPALHAGTCPVWALHHNLA